MGFNQPQVHPLSNKEGVTVFSGGAVAKNPPANAGDAGEFNPWLRKMPWRKGMVTHSGILAWEIPWTGA